MNMWLYTLYVYLDTLYVCLYTQYVCLYPLYMRLDPLYVCAQAVKTEIYVLISAIYLLHVVNTARSIGRKGGYQ